MAKRKIKFDNDNIGRKVTIRGEEFMIEKILTNKTKFRVVTGEGQPVLDYDFDDIDETTGLVVDIK